MTAAGQLSTGSSRSLDLKAADRGKSPARSRCAPAFRPRTGQPGFRPRAVDFPARLVSTTRPPSEVSLASLESIALPPPPSGAGSAQPVLRGA